jgi:hypothetical protein
MERERRGWKAMPPVAFFLARSASVMAHSFHYAGTQSLAKRHAQEVSMRIAKPLLLITTPLGVLGGLYEAWRLTGGLVLLMLALLSMMAAAVGMLVLTIREEQRSGRSS